MWTYKQLTGELFHNGKFVAKGYSGHEWGKNNPSAEAAPSVGPIPCGKWRMVDNYDSANVGPCAIKLDAVDAHPGDDKHDRTGRGAFRIHGDSIRAPGTASHGCIILQRAVRLNMWASGDHDLEVVE